MDNPLKLYLRLFGTPILIVILLFVVGTYGWGQGFDQGKLQGYTEGSRITTITPRECPTCNCPDYTYQEPTTTTTLNIQYICDKVYPCPTPPSCPTTTTQECSTFVVPAAIEEKALNLRGAAGKPPAVQHGYFLCLQDMWELYQVEGRPKFYPGPSRTEGLDYYTPLHGYNQSTICFTRDYGYNYHLGGQGFFLNSSMWKWNNTPQYWDVVNRSYYDNGTEKKWWIDTLSNLSDNLWVQER
jgi:hypothetical protein